MPFVKSFERKRRLHKQRVTAKQQQKFRKLLAATPKISAEELRVQATGSPENKFAKALEDLVRDRVCKTIERVVVFKIDPDRCYYCGCEVIRGLLTPGGKLHAQAKTKDHIIPRSKGGRKTVTACNRCNNRKKSMSLEEFRKQERPWSDPLFFGDLYT